MMLSLLLLTIEMHYIQGHIILHDHKLSFVNLWLKIAKVKDEVSWFDDITKFMHSAKPE